MIYDAHLALGEDQGAITADAATTNLLNMGLTTVPNGDITPAGMMVFDITTLGTGAGTIAFQIQDCDTVGGTYVTIATSLPVVGTALTLGKKIEVPMPGKHREFVRGFFDVTGTVGAVTVTTHLNSN